MPTLVQTVKGTLTGNGSATIASTGAGNTLIVGLAINDNVNRTLVGDTQFWTVTDTHSDAFTKAWSDASAQDTGSMFLSAAYAANIASGNTGVTFSFGSGAAAPIIYIIQEWSGLTATPFDKTNSATGSTSNPTSGSSGTLSQASELVFGVACDEVSTVPTAGSGFSNLATQTSGSNYLAIESKTVAATTAVTASFTDSTVSSWAAAVMTFKIAAAASTRRRAGIHYG